MELLNIFLRICVLTSAGCASFAISSESDDTAKSTPKSLNLIKGDMDHGSESHLSPYHKPNVVVLPTYSIYLIGFTILFMLIAIIGLAVALYLIIKKKKIFGFDINNKQYVRQESTGIATLYDSHYDEQNKNNGSTLTMNSGIIEINRVSDPVTPTRIEDSRIIFTKKPLRPILPVMQRGQMDAICKEVLRKVQKSDSASFRDLNELLNGKSEDKYETKYDIVKEYEKEKRTEAKTEVINESEHEIKHNPNTDAKTEIKNETQNETKTETKYDNKNKTINETKNEIKHEETKDVNIEINHAECSRSTEDSDTETEYDTVPSPVRFRHSGTESDDFNLDDLHVYDLPPRRSYDGKPRNVIQMDQDSQYLLPISAEKTESCYINAKRHSYNSS